MSPQKQHQDEELPELPPLEDDGSLFDGEEIEISAADESNDLDDATADNDPLDRFGAFNAIADDGSLLDYADASENLVIDEERELLAGAEIGLLEDSDEGDGRDASADEAGVFEDEGSDFDDGGAEGTNDDPAHALEAVLEGIDHGEAADDEGIDDDARFEDGSAAHDRASLEREPWPLRADVAWTITRADSVRFEGGATSEGELVVATKDSSLIVSTDGGVTFARVPGCMGVTAATILDGNVIVALHDTTRDSSAIVLVRTNPLVAELVADFIADDDDEDVRVEALAVRKVDGALEVLASGPFGALLLSPRGRG
jgi:hypothetical protein